MVILFSHFGEETEHVVLIDNGVDFYFRGLWSVCLDDPCCGISFLCRP
jgi:hypothetical protein